jgi:hypothetical protein
MQAMQVEKRNFSRCGHCQGMMDLAREGANLFLRCANCSKVGRTFRAPISRAL